MRFKLSSKTKTLIKEGLILTIIAVVIATLIWLSFNSEYIH